MKFLNKINRNYLLLFFAVLLTFSVGGYVVFQTIILQEGKETLIEKNRYVISAIEHSSVIPNMYPEISVKPIPKITITAPEFKEVYLQNKVEDEMEPFLEYSSQVTINGKCYAIELRQSLFEKEDLLLIVALAFVLLLILAFVITYLVTNKLNNTVWSKFENNLKRIEQFNFTNENELQLHVTDIEEFDRLNDIVNSLTLKLKSDYNSLKEFTENASHEIQTPLSIALINLEELLQHDLSKEEFERVVTSINSLKRLSTLNQSLILLTKIENRQFADDGMISINQLFDQKLIEFDALFKAKELSVEKKFSHDFTIKINKQLAGILINNLLSNAINHNTVGGTVMVNIEADKIEICNTGVPNSLTNESIFQRFSKGNSKTFGLGLAIIKDICKTNGLSVIYLQSDIHCFQITRTN